MCELCDTTGMQLRGYDITSQLVKDSRKANEDFKHIPELFHYTSPFAPPKLPFNINEGYAKLNESIVAWLNDRPTVHTFDLPVHVGDWIFARLQAVGARSRFSADTTYHDSAMTNINISFVIEQIAHDMKVNGQTERLKHLFNWELVAKISEKRGTLVPEWFRSGRAMRAYAPYSALENVWAYRDAMAWCVAMAMAIEYNVKAPPDEKVCLRCVAEWKAGEEVLANKVDCGHTRWNPRYVAQRTEHLAIAMPCLQCGRQSYDFRACSVCDSGVGRHHDAARLVGGASSCTTCCQHRECTECGVSFLRNGNVDHTHCNNCCECPVCTQCGSAVAQPCPNNKKHCMSCCNCTHFSPQHTRHDTQWPDGWQVQPFVPTEKQLTKNKLARLLGVELEVAGMYAQPKDFYEVCTKKWKARIMSDGSLPHWGFEMPTQPAGGDLWVDMIGEMADVLARGKTHVNQQCGTHCHVDTRDLTAQDLYRVIQLYAAVENALYAIVHPSRAKSHYSVKCGEKLLGIFSKANKATDMSALEVMFYQEKINMRTNPDTGELEINEGVGGWKPHTKLSSTHANYIKDIKRDKGFGGRYRGLNLHSHFHRGSIEFRMHHGTVDREVLTNWGITLGSVVQWAKDHSDVMLKKLLIDTKSDPMATLARVVVEVTGKNEMVDWLTKRATAMKKYAKETAWEGER